MTYSLSTNYLPGVLLVAGKKKKKRKKERKTKTPAHIFITYTHIRRNILLTMNYKVWKQNT